MTLPVHIVNGVDPDKISREVGVFAKRGGIILSSVLGINILDQDINDGVFFKWIHVGVGGNLVYRTPDNQVDCLLDVRDGQILPIIGSAILSSATIQGQTVVTSCDDITWHGGE